MRSRGLGGVYNMQVFVFMCVCVSVCMCVCVYVCVRIYFIEHRDSLYYVAIQCCSTGQYTVVL